MWLPISFKNWDDDVWYAMTYIAIQGLISGILLVILPRLLNIPLPDESFLYSLLFFILFMAFIRCAWSFPLEGSVIKSVPLSQNIKIDFPEQFRERLSFYASGLSFNSPEDEFRYNRLREILLRVKKRS